MAYEVSKEDIERVEKVLQDDIRWVMKHPRLAWHPSFGARVEDGRWVGGNGLEEGPQKCGVCAVGAHVIREGLPTDDRYCVRAAAADLQVPVDFVDDIYESVAEKPSGRGAYLEPGEEMRPGHLVGYRLRDFADVLQAEVKS